MFKGILAILALCSPVLFNQSAAYADDKHHNVTVSAPISDKLASRLGAEFKTGWEKEWRDFYKKEFGVKVDFSKLTAPLSREGFDRSLIMVPGITAQKAYNVCARHFKIWKYTSQNLDTVVVVNDRDANKTGAYVVLVRDRQEADEELKNLSTDDLRQSEISGETLTERLIHELKYFLETGRHLDVINITLVSGSRDSSGGVPSVYWYGYDREVSVDWNSPDYCRGSLRAREVVAK